MWVLFHNLRCLTRWVSCKKNNNNENNKRQQKLNYVHTLNVSSSRSNRIQQGAYYWCELPDQTSARRKDNLTRNAQRD